uniref:F-box domain-containing protein n=1 Tax=Ditylenchus dipsaci TaxID=166011 RepID=A0A915DWQ0_9BILA
MLPTEILFDVIRVLPYTSLPHLLPVSKKINKIISLCFTEENRAFEVLYSELKDLHPPHEVLGKIVMVKKEYRASILHRLVNQMSVHQLLHSTGHRCCPQFAKEAIKTRMDHLWWEALPWESLRR